MGRGVTHDNEPVVVSGLEKRILVTRVLAPCFFSGMPIPRWEEFADYIERAWAMANGVIVNTLEEMEPEYVVGYTVARGMKVSTVGPVSLYHQRATTLAARGNTTDTDADINTSWTLQVLILSHAKVGGFVTHCWWNSKMEAIAMGRPMVMWPHFMDPFLN